jgi:hypothetical protein
LSPEGPFQARETLLEGVSVIALQRLDFYPATCRWNRQTEFSKSPFDLNGQRCFQPESLNRT